jgi:hypothetical protein
MNVYYSCAEKLEKLAQIREQIEDNEDWLESYKASSCTDEDERVRKWHARDAQLKILRARRRHAIEAFQNAKMHAQIDLGQAGAPHSEFVRQIGKLEADHARILAAIEADILDVRSGAHEKREQARRVAEAAAAHAAAEAQAKKAKSHEFWTYVTILALFFGGCFLFGAH